MTDIADLIFFVLALPAIAVSLYLLLFTLLSRDPTVIPRSSRRLRFDVIVPAHNEAAVIEAVVASLRKLDWPTDRFRVVVVADNCTDTTAVLARAAGAEVLERQHEILRGKGYALEFAFEASRVKNWAYAVVVVDADTVVSPNLLEACAARIESGAKAVQAHYAVLNAQASWRTRLMAIAMAAFHQVRSRARERLQLSCGIRGNGWCVTHLLLAQVPYRAFSLTEDLEYGIDLGLAGVRVHYADEAQVAAMMVSGEQASRSQRQRWEEGRFQLIRSRTLPLLKAATRSGGAVCLDLALDLLGNVGLGPVRPAQLGNDAVFPGLPAGDDRPALEPEALGSHGLPHIDIRVAQDCDVWRVAAQRARLLNQPALLGAGDEVVHEDTEAPTRRRPEVADDRSEIVDAVKHLDDHALDPQIVAPDLLDELGVVPALDEDA